MNVSPVAPALRVQEPTVVRIPSPHRNERPAGMAVDTLVLHHTAGSGTAQDVARWFQDPQARVSSHYIVGKDGTVVEAVPVAERAWHAGRSEYQGRENVNDFSVGIEIVNRGDNVDPYPAVQYEAVARLVAYVVETQHIPLGRITRHRDVATPAGRKNDTSDNFDHAYVSKAVTELLAGRPLPPPPQPSLVEGRIVTPLQDVLPDWQYRVKPGDTLYGIARAELGDARRWRELAEMNAAKIGANQLIRVGQVINVPQN